MKTLSESLDNKVFRNSEKFGEWLNDIRTSYEKVYQILNGNGIDKYNNVLQKSGVLSVEDKGEYLGKRDFQASDNGARTSAEKDLDCIVGNIQEELFCLDNPQFKRNDKATGIGTTKDSDITSKSLDLIHIPTGTEVEFKFCYTDNINDKYDTIKYRHRNAHFDEFMRSGKIIIIYFAYLGRVAVFDYRNFKDPEKGKDKGSVRVIVKDEVDKYGKHWDIVSIWSKICIPYKMLRGGNSEISNKVSELVKRREVK